MKTIPFVYPMTLALAVALAGAGCKHQPVKTTQLGGPPDAPAVTEFQPNTVVPPGQPITQDQTPTTQPVPYVAGQPIGTSTNWDPSDPNLTADRETLAANTVHFAFDSAVVKTAEQANIQAVATFLSSNPADKLMIEGNCDERGTEEYNRSLGERRALALREALAKLSVDAQRVRTISYGKDKPADPGHDEAAFAKNRRGDFVVYVPKTGV